MTRDEQRWWKQSGKRVPRDRRWPYICGSCGAGTANRIRNCPTCISILGRTGVLNCGHGWRIVAVPDHPADDESPIPVSVESLGEVQHIEDPQQTFSWEGA